MKWSEIKKQKIEFKVRRAGEDWNSWEELPVIKTVELRDGSDLMKELVSLILVEDPAIEEVRWNRKGSLQGHYVFSHEPMITSAEVTCPACLKKMQEWKARDYGYDKLLKEAMQVIVNKEDKKREDLGDK